eukprot:jgi/Mesvir1/27572/Mv07317-RA.1
MGGNGGGPWGRRGGEGGEEFVFASVTADSSDGDDDGTALVRERLALEGFETKDVEMGDLGVEGLGKEGVGNEASVQGGLATKGLGAQGALGDAGIQDYRRHLGVTGGGLSHAMRLHGTGIGQPGLPAATTFSRTNPNAASQGAVIMDGGGEEKGGGEGSSSGGAVRQDDDSIDRERLGLREIVRARNASAGGGRGSPSDLAGNLSDLPNRHNSLTGTQGSHVVGSTGASGRVHIPVQGAQGDVRPHASRPATAGITGGEPSQRTPVASMGGDASGPSVTADAARNDSTRDGADPIKPMDKAAEGGLRRVSKDPGGTDLGAGAGALESSSPSVAVGRRITSLVARTGRGLLGKGKGGRRDHIPGKGAGRHVPVEASHDVGKGGLDAGKGGQVASKGGLDGALARRAGSCAVVGNSGSLLLYALGRAIDAHDLVIRLNVAPTKGFQRHVGGRTTFRLVNRLHMGFRETPDETVLQHVSTEDALRLFIAQQKRARMGAGVGAAAGSKGNGLFAPGGVAYAIDPDFHELALNKTDKGVLSNGFFALLLATQLCNSITVYGFFRKWRGVVRYHYFDAEQPDTMQSSRDDKERQLITNLLAEHRRAGRSFSNGEPCMGMDVDQWGADVAADGRRGDTRADGGEPAGSYGACPECPLGSHCEPGIWHPVPDPGFCYPRKHPLGNVQSEHGVPHVACFQACNESRPDEQGTCGSGERSYCPVKDSTGCDVQ